MLPYFRLILAEGFGLTLCIRNGKKYSDFSAISMKQGLNVIVTALVLSALAVQGQALTVLHSFDYYGGHQPLAGVVLSGNTLYGSTANGATNSGEIFQVNTDGSSFNILHNFTNTPDGANPQANLLLVDGTLYGTTKNGGASTVYGTLFSIDTNGGDYTIMCSSLPMVPRMAVSFLCRWKSLRCDSWSDWDRWNNLFSKYKRQRIYDPIHFYQSN